MKQSTNKVSKTILAFLIIALIAGLPLLVTDFLKTRRVDKILDRQKADPEVTQGMFDIISDTIMIDVLASEFYIRHGGQYPSGKYLMESMSPHFPAFFEDIEVKTDDDRPAASSWPETRELHIWPGYACIDRIRYDSTEYDYGQLLVRDSDKVATISTGSLIMRGDVILQGLSEAEYLRAYDFYRCDHSSPTWFRDYAAGSGNPEPAD